MNHRPIRSAAVAASLLMVAALSAGIPASALEPCSEVCICPIPCRIACSIDGIPSTCNSFGDCGPTCGPAATISLSLAAPACPAAASSTLLRQRETGFPAFLANPAPAPPAIAAGATR